MKRTIVQFTAFLFLLAITYKSIYNPFAEAYIEALKSDVQLVSAQHDALYQKIEERAKDYEKPAANARIDPVWKRVPGYNGIKVDLAASYKNMKPAGKFDEKKLVYKQVRPKVHLRDLPQEPIYRGHDEKPMVSFTVNVAWGNDYLPKMLEVLKKHHAKATFFLEGKWVKNNPDMAKMIVDAGHEVGNHSYSHPDMATLSASQINQQLKKTNDIITSTTGQKVKWFAPPSGSFRPEVVTLASQLKMSTIMWTVDTIDWQKPSSEVLINRVMKKIHPGAIVLMHPTESTAESLDQLLTDIERKGLKVSDVSTMLDEERMMKIPSSTKK
ncbi:polysaccharide deacetylase family protein [Priestia aryabhattai]|uniref:polysaccharide deacetylase family protein n=1 Tax=Priestia aryabhattai TaxID=412384 RepID=UPI003D296FA1